LENFIKIFEDNKNLDRLMNNAQDALNNLKIETVSGYDKTIKRDLEKVLRAFDNLRITVRDSKK